MEDAILPKEELNRIGLDEDKSEELANHLNNLLANYSVFYQNVRAYHWNVEGEQFFVLHEKFEELYENLFEKIDAIAERILTLGFHPDHNFSHYLKTSAISESHGVESGYKAVKEVLDAFKIILKKQRTILELSGSANDEGTNALMSDYISEQEKTVWMYSAYLNEPK